MSDVEKVLIVLAEILAGMFALFLVLFGIFYIFENSTSNHPTTANSNNGVPVGDPTTTFILVDSTANSNNGDPTSTIGKPDTAYILLDSNSTVYDTLIDVIRNCFQKSSSKSDEEKVISEDDFDSIGVDDINIIRKGGF